MNKYNKILLPYQQVNHHITNYYQFVRCKLNGGVWNDYISSWGSSLLWSITSYTCSYYSHTGNGFSSCEEAKLFLDAMLVKNGYTLLNSFENVDKYLVLL